MICAKCGERPAENTFTGVWPWEQFRWCAHCANPPCPHGVPNGDQPDPWTDDRLICRWCRGEAS